MRCIAGLDAEVLVRNLTAPGESASARSVLAITTLGAHRDHEVQVRASGPDAEEAVTRVLALAASGFDDWSS